MRNNTNCCWKKAEALILSVNVMILTDYIQVYDIRVHAGLSSGIDNNPVHPFPSSKTLHTGSQWKSALFTVVHSRGDSRVCSMAMLTTQQSSTSGQM